MPLDLIRQVAILPLSGRWTPDAHKRAGGVLTTPRPRQPLMREVAMNTFPADARPVNPERAAFRPRCAAGRDLLARRVPSVHVLLSGRRKADAYGLIPISTDIGGAAFRWFKQGGESYDVLGERPRFQRHLRGLAYTGGCKHLQMTFELLRLAALAVAPGSTSGDEEAA